MKELYIITSNYIENNKCDVKLDYCYTFEDIIDILTKIFKNMLISLYQENDNSNYIRKESLEFNFMECKNIEDIKLMYNEFSQYYDNLCALVHKLHKLIYKYNNYHNIGINIKIIKITNNLEYEQIL